MNIYTATLIIQKHLNWQNDKRNLPKVNKEKLKEATELLTELVEKVTITDVVLQSEQLCGKSNCNRQKLEGNVYCSYHYDINFG